MEVYKLIIERAKTDLKVFCTTISVIRHKNESISLQSMVFQSYGTTYDG